MSSIMTWLNDHSRMFADFRFCKLPKAQHSWQSAFWNKYCSSDANQSLRHARITVSPKTVHVNQNNCPSHDAEQWANGGFYCVSKSLYTQKNKHFFSNWMVRYRACCVRRFEAIDHQKPSKCVNSHIINIRRYPKSILSMPVNMNVYTNFFFVLCSRHRLILKELKNICYHPNSQCIRRLNSNTRKNNRFG